MNELLTKFITLEKVSKKLDILLNLLSEQEPNYSMKLSSSYDPLDVDDEIVRNAIKEMIKKYVKVRKKMLKDLKQDVKLLK